MHHRSRLPEKPRGVGAALSLALALALSASPALAAPPFPATEPDPVPGLVAGEGTAAPQLVTGLSEPAPGSPAEAARAHLAAHPDRYRIDTAQLTELAVEHAAEGRDTVRFQQHHGGVPVLGGQYLVRLVGEGADRTVESVGGKYFTGLTAPTAPAVSDEALRGLALDSVADRGARGGATAEDGGRIVLPGGGGRLVQRFVVRAADPATGAPLVREVFVDAVRGVVALARDTRAPYPTGGATAPGTPAAAAAPAADVGVPVIGTAPDILGRTVPVNVARRPDGSHQLVDLTRGAGIFTYDAAGEDAGAFRGPMTGRSPVSSPGPDFPASTGTGGATDAHLNAAAAYDFFRDRLGRNGLDGKGGPIVSVANTSEGGKPSLNAFWDGVKMVYGNGDATYRPFSVAMDVVGHELTHAVVQHTADLDGSAQPGAMNEALADYFGNAIEVTTRGIPMTDPRAALMNESLCRTGTPEECARRRLDDRRTTVDDYIGAWSDVDNSGVHLNATIFGGALWDIRRALDPLVADRLVYRAITEYLTPLDEFVDGRNAVLAAGRSLGLSRAQLRTVAAAFDAHGIKAGWQSRIGMDSRGLLRSAGIEAPPAVAGGHWVASGRDDPKSVDESLYTGSVTAPGTRTRLSPPDGRIHLSPDTDGRTAVWQAIGFGVTEVLARPLSGGPVRSVFNSPDYGINGARISDGQIAVLVTSWADGRNRLLVFRDGADPVDIPVAEGHRLSDLAFKDGLLGWIESWNAEGATFSAPTVYSLAAGRITAQYPESFPAGDRPGQLTSAQFAGGRLLWSRWAAPPDLRVAIRSGAADGSGVTDVVPADSPYAPTAGEFTASDRVVTYQRGGAKPSGGWTNAALPKLYQVPVTGGAPVRLSCNRGVQAYPAADRGTRVLWLDYSPGRIDLVVRDRPAGTC
ncbi:M4 family metallopeptidase [Kitasatospora sp. NPDC058406]|uniref:M4 family metallopeptidase n=1 Tax=Kitasatospora sp. NPDC058406 TaxID=3346483 RepID=UPI00364F3BED